jgi:hypothetical protein
MTEKQSQPTKPLSERPLGYGLAVLGGLLGAPLGLLTSPAVLYVLNQQMKGKEGKQPNRFAAWALIGIIGAPISLAIGNPAFRQGYEQGSSAPEATANSSSNNTSESNEEKPTTSVTAGDFTISNVKITPYKGDTKGADIAGELWAVYASVSNNSKETKVPAHNLTTEIVDSEDRKFKSADFVVTSNAIVDEAFGGAKVTRFTDGILPGSTRDNVEVGVFDVTKGATGLRLCAGALFSGTKCIN